MLTAYDSLLVIAALIVMLTGLVRHWVLLRRKGEPGLRRDWLRLIAYLGGHRKIGQRRWVGVAHFCLVWGFGLFIGVVIVAQIDFTSGPAFAKILSTLLDLTGLMMLCATIFFIIRRQRIIATQPNTPRLKGIRWGLGLLLLILVSGFWAEGARLSIVPSLNPVTTPVGWLFAAVSPASPLFLQWTIRLHFFAVLIFIAFIPYSFMRHIVFSAVNVLNKENAGAGLPTLVDLNKGPYGAGSVQDFTSYQLREVDACVTCGRCDDYCPAVMAQKALSPRQVMTAIATQMDMDDGRTGGCPTADDPNLIDTIAEDALWSCTTCMACVTHCPVYARPMDKVIELRRHQVMVRGALPEAARPMIRNLELFGDVFGKGAAYRAHWALNRSVKAAHETPNPGKVLLWVGCSGAFHPAYQQTTRALVRILQTAAVDFTILAKNELCCGDPARRLGDEALFESLAIRNIQSMRQYNIDQIVTLCPHCFHTLRHEYPLLGAQCKVVHAAEFVRDLIERGSVSLRYPPVGVSRVTVHDPCYLGRYNGIYKPLRDLCRAVPDVTVIELPRHGGQGFCCGGGGGRMWLHDTQGMNINDLRAQEVAAAGVDLVGTACPYCLTMLEDGIKSLERDQPPQAKDIIELVADAMA